MPCGLSPAVQQPHGQSQIFQVPALSTPLCRRPARPQQRPAHQTPAPAQAVITGASSGRALASLRLSPGAWPHFTQLDPFQAPAWLVPALPGVGFTGAPPMKSPALAALIACKLPGLQHLAFAPDRDGQAELFGELRRMSRLTSLDLLAGAPVEGKPLQVGRRACWARANACNVEFGMRIWAVACLYGRTWCMLACCALPGRPPFGGPAT